MELVGTKWLFKQECSLADIVDIVILNDALYDHKGITEKTFFFDNNGVLGFNEIGFHKGCLDHLWLLVVAMLARNVCRKLSEEWEVIVVKDDSKEFSFR